MNRYYKLPLSFMNIEPTLLRLLRAETEGNTNHERVRDCAAVHDVTFQEARNFYIFSISNCYIYVFSSSN